MATKGYGTIFTANSVVTGLVMDISTPDISVEEIDISNMDSTLQWREFISGWKVGGEPSVTIQHVEATTALLYALVAVDDTDFIIEFSNGATWTFTGYVSALAEPDDIDGIVTTELSIKITGVPVFAVAA